MRRLKKALLGLASAHMLAWLAMLVAFAGILFLALGCYGALATAVAPWAAALIVGAGLLTLLGAAIAITVFCILRHDGETRNEAAASMRSTADQQLEEAMSAVVGERATRWTRDNTGVAMLGALAVGVLLASSPRARSGLYGIVRPLVARQLKKGARRHGR